MFFWKCLHKASFSLKMCSILPRLIGSLILLKFLKPSSVPDRLRPCTSSPGPQFSPKETFPDLFLVPYPNLLPDPLSCFSFFSMLSHLSPDRQHFLLTMILIVFFPLSHFFIPLLECIFSKSSISPGTFHI